MQVRHSIVLALLCALGCGRSFDIAPEGSGDPADASGGDESSDDGTVPELPELNALYFDDGRSLILFITNDFDANCDVPFGSSCEEFLRFGLVVELQPGQRTPGTYQLSSTIAFYMYTSPGPRPDCDFGEGLADVGQLRVDAVGETIEGALIDLDLGLAGTDPVNGSFLARPCGF